MGHILKLITVAEYVEDVATLDLLRELAVGYAQAFLFGKPNPEIPVVPRKQAA